MFSQVKKSCSIVAIWWSIMRRGRAGRVLALRRLTRDGHAEPVVAVLVVDRRHVRELDRAHQVVGPAHRALTDPPQVQLHDDVDRAVGREPRGILAGPVRRRELAVELVTAELERLDRRYQPRAVHDGDVERVGAVLRDHLRVRLDPVHHPHVGRDRVVVGLLELVEVGGAGELPQRRAPETVVPDHHAAVPLVQRPHLQLEVLLAPLRAVGDQRVAALAAPVPSVPRADDVLPVDGALHPEVAAEVQAVGVARVEPAGLPSPQDDLATEVLDRLHLAASDLVAPGDLEPARRVPAPRERQGRRPLGRGLGRGGGRFGHGGRLPSVTRILRTGPAAGARRTDHEDTRSYYRW